MAEEDDTMDGDTSETQDVALEKAFQAFCNHMREKKICVGHNVKIVLYPDGQKDVSYENCPSYKGELLGFHGHFAFLRIEEETVDVFLKRYMNIVLLDPPNKKVNNNKKQ